MNKDEFNWRLKRLKMTHTKFAEYIGLHRPSVSCWKEIPLYAIRIVELLEFKKGIIHDKTTS